MDMPTWTGKSLQDGKPTQRAIGNKECWDTRGVLPQARPQNLVVQVQISAVKTHIQVTYWLCRLYFGMYTCNDNENRGHEFEGEQRDVYEIGERKGGNCILIFYNINKKK